jgi:hypothetical protein
MLSFLSQLVAGSPTGADADADADTDADPTDADVRFRFPSQFAFPLRDKRQAISNQPAFPLCARAPLSPCSALFHPALSCPTSPRRPVCPAPYRSMRRHRPLPPANDHAHALPDRPCAYCSPDPPSCSALDLSLDRRLRLCAPALLGLTP